MVYRLVKAFIHFLLPAHCPSCNLMLEGETGVCPACWRKLNFITQNCCDQCGLPFDIDFDSEAISTDDGAPIKLKCGRCLADPPPYQKARQLLAYDEASSGLILPLKHGDRTEYVPLLAGWLGNLGQTSGLIDQVDFLMPVPLHYRRLVKRRYNQAALLSAWLSKLWRIPHAADLIKRKRATKSQGHLTWRQRHVNVRGAFIVRPRWRSLIQGKIILIIDDVMTTGATLESCTRVLLRAGAKEVRCLALARVVRAVRLDGKT